MGWLYRDEPIDDPLTYLKAKYNYDCETHTLQTLDGARVGNPVYLAVRPTDKQTGRSFVFAAVIMISNTKKWASATRTRTNAWDPTNAIAPSASCGCSRLSPSCRTSASPPTGAFASLPGTLNSANAGSTAPRSVSAASSR